MHRPTGITIIAILAILGGLFALCGGTLGIVGSGLSGIGKLVGFDNVRPGALFVNSSVSLFLGVLNIVFGVGALLLKQWAWLLGIAIEIATIIDKGIDFAQGDGRVFAGLGIAIAAIILGYLCTAPVRRAFGRVPNSEQISPTSGA